MRRTVELHGGPMDGWLVTPDAPALKPDWYRTLPLPPRQTFWGWLRRKPAEQVTARPGRYVVDGDGSATWMEA